MDASTEGGYGMEAERLQELRQILIGLRSAQPMRLLHGALLEEPGIHDHAWG
jgi:hypothetical protein